MNAQKLDSLNVMLKKLMDDFDAGKIAGVELSSIIANSDEYKEFENWVLKDFTKNTVQENEFLDTITKDTK